MQITYEQAMGSGLFQAFATRRGSGYMMRSEKRGGAYGGGSRRPPRRKKAGFGYIFLTLLVSVILWPLGMVMLWRRKVRLQAGTKLLISLLTLCVSVFLIVFALTMPVDNPEFTAFQDKANDWLDKAAADVAVAGDAALKKTTETWHVMSDFAVAGTDYALKQGADVLDKGVDLAGQARASIEDLFHREPAAPAATDAPEATELPTDTDAPAEEATEVPTDTDAPAEEATEVPADTEVPAEEATEVPADTDAPAEEATEVPANTDAPAEEATEVPTDTDAPAEEATDAPDEAEPAATVDIHLPGEAPDPKSGQPLSDGTLHADGSFEPGEADVEPAPTAEPEGEAWAFVETPTEAPQEPSPEEEAAAPAVTEETPAETAEEPTEAPQEPSPEEEPTAPAVTDETPTEPAEEPAEAPQEPSPEEEPAAPAVTEEIFPETTPEPTEAPTEEPTEEPTAAPASYAVKPAGDATVYYYDVSKGFHAGPNRHEMNGAPAHTLAEAFAEGKHTCVSCGMPEESILSEEHVAWVDADNRLHTTDECAAFQGQWKLMSLADAVAEGCAPCADCGADAYVEAIYPAPTPTPEPVVVTPSTALKPAGELTVYFYDSSKGYHVASSCKGMRNAPAHTLAEARAEGKRACGICKPVALELLDQPALWLDEDNTCHTSDECAAFHGKVSLIARDEALAQGLAACPECGAAEYLQPGTVIAQ